MPNRISLEQALAEGWHIPNQNNGNCECGCGKLAPIARCTEKQWGSVKGELRHFVIGHNMAGEQNPIWRGDKAGTHSIHIWLNKHHPRTGICKIHNAFVGLEKTCYAFLHHPNHHSRNISDYIESCWSCHRKFDIKQQPTIRSKESIWV